MSSQDTLTPVIPRPVAKKPPPAHKRHTKPCKYFQTNRCPYPAEACNFAHVLVPHEDIVCRYYLSGHCQHGTQCRYRHPGEDSRTVSEATLTGGEWYDVSEKPTEYGRGYTTPSYYTPVPHDWSYANGIAHPTPVFVAYYPVAPVHRTADSRQHLSLPATDPIPLSHSTSHSSTVSTGDTTFSFEELRVDSEHEDSASTSSSSLISSESCSTVSDELIISTTEEPPTAKPVETGHGGYEFQPAFVVRDPPPRILQPIPQPVFYHPVPAIVGGRYPSRPPSAQQQQYARATTPGRQGARTPAKTSRETPSAPASRSASRNSNRIKPSKYKSKPCKFWNKDGVCPSGSECTFRHDEPYPPPVPPLPAGMRTLANVPPRLVKSRSVSTPLQSTELVPSDRGPSDLKKDTSWRVIGGGVRVGTQTWVAQQWANGDAGHTGERAKHVAAPTLPSDSTAAQSGNGPAEIAAKAQIDGDRSLKVGKPATALQVQPAKMARKRSNSIPATPSSAQFQVKDLFNNAESPGVL